MTAGESPYAPRLNHVDIYSEYKQKSCDDNSAGSEIEGIVHDYADSKKKRKKTKLKKSDL